MAWILNDPPPKFWAELAECQIYQLIADAPMYALYLSSSSSYKYCLLPLPVTPRGNPTIIGIPVAVRIENGQVLSGASVSTYQVSGNGVVLRVSGASEPCNVCFPVGSGLDFNL